LVAVQMLERGYTYHASLYDENMQSIVVFVLSKSVRRGRITLFGSFANSTLWVMMYLQRKFNIHRKFFGD